MTITQKCLASGIWRRQCIYPSYFSYY